MTVALYAALALLIGFGSAVQVGMVASIGRGRGAPEAAWVNIIGAILALAIFFSLQALRDNPPNLPSPFSNSIAFVGVALLAGFAISISLRGMSPYLGIAGMFGFVYLMGAGFLAPRIGIALFASAVTAGTLIGSVSLDHIGAFGTEVHRVTFMRLCGLAFLVLGVVFVRSGR